MEQLYERSIPRARELLSAGLTAQPPRLDWAALAIAALERPEVNVAAVEERFDALAKRVVAHRGPTSDLDASLLALRTVLGEEEGLRGSDDAGGAPASFVDDVLEK